MSAYFALAITVTGAFLGICALRRSAGLAVFLGLLPAYLIRFAIPLPGLAGGLPSTLLETMFWTLFITWLFTEGAKPGAWDALKEWSAPIALFAVGASVSVLVSPDLRGGLGLWRAYVLEPLLFFPMFVDIMSRERRGAWVLGALGGLCAAIGVTAVIQKVTGYGIPNPVWQAEATRRVTSVFGFPNAIGLLSAPIVVLMAGWSIALVETKASAKKALALLPAAAAALGAAAIAFAVSEGAMIGAAAGLAALGLFHRRLRVATLTLIIAASLTFIAWRPARDYLSLAVSLRDDSGSVRAIIWGETATMLADNPVFGAGMSGYPGRIAPYHGADWIEIFMYPHDLFLNFWSETGLLGLAGFLWIVGRFFADSLRLGRKGGWIVAANAAAMTAVVVHGLVDVPYFKNDLAFLFWTLIGITETVRRSAAASALDKAKAALQRLPQSPWLT